ncbi:MAG: hypothetical protein M1526_06940 [Candidatus Thermoplasmatota archaeon]|nr:hypothetical protein [Candidatus Thermoplasmatota archaeon]MCL5680442.1 hypothetical protein [Candidatus Thermoplasmatota archaeon]
MKIKVILVTLVIIVSGIALVGVGAEQLKNQYIPSTTSTRLNFTLVGNDEYVSQVIMFSGNTSLTIFFNATSIYLIQASNNTNYSIEHIKNVSIKPKYPNSGEYFYVNVRGAFVVVALSSSTPTALYATGQQNYQNSNMIWLVYLGILIMMIGAVALFFVIMSPEPES